MGNYLNPSFVENQLQSSKHKLAIYLLPLVVFVGYFHPVIFIIGISFFFLITSFQLLKSMIFWMLIIGGISALIPVLAPIIFIVMIILFLMRIGFVIENWKPFVSGIIFYGFMAILIYRSFLYYDGYGWDILYLYYYFPFASFFEGLIMSLISFLSLRIILKKLYSNGYECYQALGIMGSAPLIIISFLLPFLKLHIGGDFFVGETTVTEATPSYTNEVTTVQEHVRTMPDGDVRNNLSYTGSDKTLPNDQLVEVKSHIRTLPNETVADNLSYRSHSNSIVETTFKSEKASTLTEPIVTITGNRYNSEATRVNRLLETVKRNNKNKILAIVTLTLLISLSIWGISSILLPSTQNSTDRSEQKVVKSPTEPYLQNDRNGTYIKEDEGNPLKDAQLTEGPNNNEHTTNETIEFEEAISSEITEENPSGKTYRLQVGAYMFEENAREVVDELNRKGFSAYAKKEGQYVKVQAGAYSIKENAEKAQRTLEEAGFEVLVTEE